MYMYLSITQIRPRLQIFLSKMHQPDGSYIMHTDGETDVRCVCVCVCVPAFIIIHNNYIYYIEGTQQTIMTAVHLF